MSKTPARADGCGFYIATIVFTCLLLLLNGVVATTIYQVFSDPKNAPSVQQLKVIQMFLFIGPVLMLFIEWTLFDFWLKRVWLRRRKKPE
jgi:hypothetical protein